jgi:hypothetical protein
MKKITVKDVKNGLKRDEMRFIFGGSGYNNSTSVGCGVGTSASNNSSCVDICFIDSDCSCFKDSAGNSKYCAATWCSYVGNPNSSSQGRFRKDCQYS